MGRRNQGKARRAAKAKAREEAGRRGDDLQAANSSAQPSSLALGQVPKMCTHGYTDPVGSTNIFPVREFVTAFRSSFFECGDNSVTGCLEDAYNATWDKFSDVWNDPTKLEIAVSYCLSIGTEALVGTEALAGTQEDYSDIAREFATFARYIKQYIAVHWKQSRALVSNPKLLETHHADDHTLVKFFRHRIPCSCLDEKYEGVKHITKLGFCWNPKCAGRRVERSKLKDCSRCRNATYCSRECQVADWLRHKSECDAAAEVIAKFDAFISIFEEDKDSISSSFPSSLDELSSISDLNTLGPYG